MYIYQLTLSKPIGRGRQLVANYEHFSAQREDTDISSNLHYGGITESNFW